MENIAATRSLKDIWIEVNKVRGVQRGVKVVGDPQSVADELIDKWAHAASRSCLPTTVRREFHKHEFERSVFIQTVLTELTLRVQL